MSLAQNQEAIDRRAHLESLTETLKDIPLTLFIKESGKATWDINVETDLYSVFSQVAH